MSSLNDNRFPSLSLHPKYVFGAGASFGVFLAGWAYGYVQATPPIKQYPMQQCTQLETQHIGLAEYERILPKMTIVEVQAVLGRGTEINRSETSVTLIWKNSNGSKITAIFEKGLLKSKEQSDLL